LAIPKNSDLMDANVCPVMVVLPTMGILRSNMYADGKNTFHQVNASNET
jgi:hypothetical protein